MSQSLSQLRQIPAEQTDADLIEWLGSIQPISEPIAPRKQAAKRHYGSHPYFTKRAWNVVQAYIENFSRAGDLVLDPFGGAGVTAVEALALGRRAIHIDLAPLANLITWGVAVAPVDIAGFRDEYINIQRDCEMRIRSLYQRSLDEIENMPVPYWYPTGVRLPRNADVATVEACFHRRSLIALSILHDRIGRIQDHTIRDLFRLVFAATLNKTNLTFSSTTGRKDSRGDSAIFRVYQFDRPFGNPVPRTAWLLRGTEALSQLPQPDSTSHGEMILRIARLGKAADLVPHVGRNEQSEFVHGTRLGDIGRTDLPNELDLTRWETSKVQQIDCVWFNAEGEPVCAFEVESSTQITSAIDRFLELLRARPGLARRVVIVIPSTRTRKLDSILRDSHYIGHPLYMETKLGWLYFEDVVRLYNSYVGKKPPSADQLLQRLDGLIRAPKIAPNWR